MFEKLDRPSFDASEVVLRHEIGSVRGWQVAPDETAGDEAFVLLHGLGAGARVLQGVAGRLRHHGRVLVLDLPGFGNLDRPTRAMDITDFAHATADLLDDLGVTRPPVLVGHSMGCQVAVELARHRPDLADRMVLVSPVLPPPLRGLLPATRAFLRLGCRERTGSIGWSLLGYARAGLPWLVTTLPAVLHHRIDERMEGLQGRLLLLRGERDPLCPADWAEELARRSGARAEVRQVDGAAHLVVVDDARAVADAALEMVGLR